jgi:hypothetical protein
MKKVYKNILLIVFVIVLAIICLSFFSVVEGVEPKGKQTERYINCINNKNNTKEFCNMMYAVDRSNPDEPSRKRKRIPYGKRRNISYYKRRNIPYKKSTYQSPRDNKEVAQGKYYTTYQTPEDYIPLAFGTRFQIGPDSASKNNPRKSEYTDDLCDNYEDCVAKNGVDACAIFKASYC